MYGILGVNQRLLLLVNFFMGLFRSTYCLQLLSLNLLIYFVQLDHDIVFLSPYFIFKLRYFPMKNEVFLVKPLCYGIVKVD